MNNRDLTAAGDHPRRLFVYNGGFWFKPRLKRILELSGWQICLGVPKAGDDVGVWGASPTAWRGRGIAVRRGADLVTVEDAFLRSILPGRAKGRLARRGPLGLLIDPDGLHFDPARASRIEKLVPKAKGFESDAKEIIARLRDLDLSKYNHHRSDLAPPSSGYVLVIDQTRGDASLMGADRSLFLEMLAVARDENPNAQIVLRSHPETSAGLRFGHLGRDDLRAGDIFCDAPISPWRLVENADAVYAVSSQLGYEALLAGHRPVLFGQPFYAGWGLTDDRRPLPPDRRGSATAEALFAASHMLAPVWYDPCRDCLTDINGVIDQLEAEAKVYRQDRNGHLAFGMRLWKRPFLARAFGDSHNIRFTDKPSEDVTLAWAGKTEKVPQAIHVEDGFLRSRGLGAALTPPLSLVADDLGIYYDPTRASRLEYLISAPLPPGAEERANKLIQTIRNARLSKYNLSGEIADLPAETAHALILVPGQVEDDASIRLGAGIERSNLGLLKRVRAENPQAIIIYKPHPDVEAGLRLGSIPTDILSNLADHVVHNADPIDLLDRVDEVWTITSTLGFEALLRNIPVTVLGAPFYAGWGLTRDLGAIPERRKVKVGIAALTHAALIAYPRYRDPKTGLPCPAELALERLVDPALKTGGPALRVLAKLQGALASYAWIWRR